MKPRVAVLLAVLLAAAQLSACSRHAASQPKFKIALVAAAPGSGYDAYNGAAESGLRTCNRDTGTPAEIFAPQSSDDSEAKIVLAATENFDEVIALGFPTAVYVTRAARRFEATQFTIVDAVGFGANVESITFNEQQGAFLAGALAALVSRTKNVAFLGGADSALLEKSEAGFTAGAREIDPRVRVRTAYLGSFTDAVAGKARANALFQSGTDIVYVVAGAAGLGAIDAAKARRDSFVIGTDSDQDALAPGKVLASVVKRIDVAVERACNETVAQKHASGHVVLGLADDGIELTPFTYTKKIVGAANAARLLRVRQAIVDGRITAPDSRAALARFNPVAVP